MLMLATRKAGRSLSSSFFKMQNALACAGGGVGRECARSRFLGGAEKLDTDETLMLIIVCSIKISN